MFSKVLGAFTLTTFLGAVAAAQVGKTNPPANPGTNPGKATPGQKPQDRPPGTDRPAQKDGDRGDQGRRGSGFDPSRDPDGSGRFMRFDRDRRSLLLGPGTAGGRETTYQVSPDAEVLIDGKPGRFEDLKEGDPVRVWFDPARTSILAAYVGGPLLRGTLTEVDAARKALTFKPGDGAARTVTVAAGASVILNGRDAQLGDLPAGSPVSVWLARDEKTAIWVMAGRGVAPPDRPEGSRAGRGQPDGGTVVTGKLVTYDKDRKTLTVAPPEGERITALMDKGTEVVIDGKRGAITAIPDNHPVRVALNGDRTVALRISAEGPTQKRKLIGVLPNRFSLQLDRGSDTEEVPVAKDAEIVVNGKDAKLEDLQPGDTATVRFAIDRKTIVGVQVGLPKPDSGKLPVKD